MDIAARVARQANPAIRYETIPGNIVDAKVAARLTDADYLFLCADEMPARLVFNALVHQYVIPGARIGSKVPVEKISGAVGDVLLVAQRVLPYPGGGCLTCNQLLPPDRLREALLTPDERRREGYVTDAAVTAPSVITLNALAAAQAVDDFLFGVHGLLHPGTKEGYLQHYPRERLWQTVACAQEETCIHCGSSGVSAYARGDRAVLACRRRA